MGGKLGAVLLALTLAVAGPARAADDPLSLYRAAREANAGFAAAEAAYRADREAGAQGRALLLPKVRLHGQVLELRQSEPMAFGGMSLRPEGTSASYGIALTQTLYNAADFAAADQARDAGELAELRLRAAEIGLLLDLTRHYFALLQAQDGVRLLREQRAAAEHALADAAERYRLGEATITDRYEAQARLDAIAAASLAAEQELSIAREQLARVAGRPVEAVLPLQAEPILPPLHPTGIDEWLTRTEGGDPRLRILRTALAIAAREPDKHRALAAPVVELVAEYGRDPMLEFLDLAGIRNDGHTASIGVRLSVPLYTGGARSSQYRQAVAGAEQARRELLEATRRTAVETRAAFLGVETGLARVRALERNLASAASRLESTQTGKSVGARTTLDVLDAQQDYYRVRRELLSARYRYLLSMLELRALSGELGERHLAELGDVLAR